jgi:hypothetical protein
MLLLPPEEASRYYTDPPTLYRSVSRVHDSEVIPGHFILRASTIGTDGRTADQTMAHGAKISLLLLLFLLGDMKSRSQSLIDFRIEDSKVDSVWRKPSKSLAKSSATPRLGSSSIELSLPHLGWFALTRSLSDPNGM